MTKQSSRNNKVRRMAQLYLPRFRWTPPTKFINFAGPDGGELGLQQERSKFSSCGGVPRSGEVVFYLARAARTV